MVTKPKSPLNTLDYHINQVLAGKRKFENVFEAVTRMILAKKDAYKKVKVNGKTVYDFKIFKDKPKHLIGLYNEINSFVSFVKDAAEGGSSAEMAYVLVGEPGNGKTFFVDYICNAYREFLSQEENRRYTFKFTNLDKLGKYGDLKDIESQTFEDPMILAMNLDLNLREKHSKKYRPLGACSDYILNEIKEYTNNDVTKIKEFIKVVPVTMSETMGTVTGKYSARDKITSSAKDLLGEESIQRLLYITDTNNPYRIDLRIGALARVGGGGIHFSDEIFKNKKDLVQVYLGVIQNRNIEIDGYKWPIDTLILATSNNEEFANFIGDKEESPIVDRCRICYFGHNTNYKLQEELTNYSLGSKNKTTMCGESLHMDPNLNFAVSNAVVLSRLPKSEKLTSLDIRKLAAGEIAGDKSVKTLVELIEDLQRDPDVTKRFGQRGIGHRNLGRALQILMADSETQEGKCMFAENVFKALEYVVLDYIQEPSQREKYLEDIKESKSLYREKVRTTMFDAYMDEPHAIKKEVLNYINMIVGMDSQEVGVDKMYKYIDPGTGRARAIKIDETYIKSVESRLGLTNNETREAFRTTMRRIYGRKAHTDPNYDFMDNLELVKAVTDVRLQSDVAGAGSLVGALANRTNDENKKLYNKIIDTMINKLGYCNTCAQKTIDYFCTRQDES